MEFPSWRTLSSILHNLFYSRTHIMFSREREMEQQAHLKSLLCCLLYAWVCCCCSPPIFGLAQSSCHTHWSIVSWLGCLVADCNRSSKVHWRWNGPENLIIIHSKICNRYLAKTMLRSALLEISSRSELKNRSLLEIWNWTAAGLIPKYGQEHNCCCTTKIATIFVHIWELHLKGDILWCLDQTFCHKF